MHGVFCFQQCLEGYRVFAAYLILRSSPWCIQHILLCKIRFLFKSHMQQHFKASPFPSRLLLVSLLSFEANFSSFVLLEPCFHPSVCHYFAHLCLQVCCAAFLPVLLFQSSLTCCPSVHAHGLISIASFQKDFSYSLRSFFLDKAVVKCD